MKYDEQKWTYSMRRTVGGTEATGARWPQAPWRGRLQGTAHSMQPPGASTSTEAACGDTSWPTVGWSTESVAAPNCSGWCCVGQGGTETPWGSCLQRSWGNLWGSDRMAGCWDTPTSCWQSWGGAMRHWSGWETGWAGRTQRTSCAEAGTRSSSDQAEGHSGCVCGPVLCPASV